MKTIFYFLLFSIVTIQLHSQSTFPDIDFSKISSQYIETYKKNQLNNENHIQNSSENNMLNLSQILRTLNEVKEFEFENYLHSPNKSGDTLYIGLTPQDSMYITGDFFHNGTVMVYGDGVLHFENANAQINGDMIVWGETARLTVINSQLHFPQSFLYHRKLMCMEGARFYVENSTLNYSGLSRELVVYGESSVIWRNVTNIGFTTWGVSGQPVIDIDETNQAGEFVILDNADISIKNASHILLWHHIPQGAEISYSFPDGSNISLYEFSDAITGIENIGYSYIIEDCSDVMWGLMPEPGSICNISDSYIKAVGVWFSDLEDFTVSGLVNNSYYSIFSAPLSDHTINLTNTSVEIWSLYFFEDAVGNVSNCIIGELGTFDNSNININNCLIDGSGGYIFSNAASFNQIFNTYLNCDLIARDASFAVYAYGGQNWGRTIANDYSIMIVIQPNLSAPPEFNDNAMVWYLKLEGQSTLFANSINPIYGSAWMDKASEYYPNEMDYFQIDYRSINDENWIPVCGPVYNEVYSSQLCEWNTQGLTPGSYVLRITMFDDTPDNNAIEAVRVYNLELPTNLQKEEKSNFSIYPNPVGDYIELADEHQNSQITIYDNKGGMVLQKNHGNGNVNVKHLQSGSYILQIVNKNGVAEQYRFVKM